MRQRRDLFFNIWLLVLYLVFLGYGTLCLFDHRIDLSHNAETSESSSSHRHNESKGSEGLLHSCLTAQNLLSTFLVTGLIFLTLVLILYLYNLFEEEKVYQANNLFRTSRSPPFFSIHLVVIPY